MDSHDRKAGASEPETSITQSRRPAPGEQSPVLSESRHPGERLFVRMSLAPAAVPNPGSTSPEFWWVGPLFALNTFVNSARDRLSQVKSLEDVFLRRCARMRRR